MGPDMQYGSCPICKKEDIVIPNQEEDQQWCQSCGCVWNTRASYEKQVDDYNSGVFV